jgi:DsbC/DsbD-like thiol-disulfide interchange protein
VPYPGVFVLDEQGVVVEKRFQQGYRVRPSGAALADDLAPAPSETSRFLSVWTSDALYRPYQQLNLHIELNLPDGRHVYGRPIPEGYTPLEIEVEPLPGLVVGEPRLPTPRAFQIEGLDERFVVHDRRVRAVVPFHAEEVEGPLRLAVRVRYQACTNTLCHPPTEERLEVTLEPTDLIRE